MRPATVLMLACLIPARLAAQRSDEHVGRAPRRLSLVFDLGPTVGGPGAGLAAQLREAGFGNTSPETCFLFCVGPIAHPTQEGPGTAAALTARFALSTTVAVGAGFGSTPLGGSIGYRPGGLLGQHVISDWDATMVWVGAFWRPRPALRLGGGPGWYQLSAPPEDFKVSRLGLMAEAGAEVPTDSRFFMDLAIRVHVVPAKDVEYGRTVQVRLHPNWTHATLLVGLGLHF